ncbi:TnsA-like heteromeric transposase endonuclease subunit [Microbacterium sp. kSW2-24]|uniref:TnsA-like heteromeric transposase endonuclease subunit n=1 Tax=Microbacterium galbinum TaxID=2851646 RepID=UPI001FFC5924|nr:TnsA-like heteromeric transposase endonuclease subunit [Microbacterium galbinum]MCK2022701.1 TnsA-like heteromeric transposase endonuclease subunit [Microbacterium galbinum]
MRFDSWDVPQNSLADEGAVRVAFVLDGRRREADAGDIDELPFELCEPVRAFPSWRLKRHYSGSLWMSTLKRHVVFESFAERAFLLELDRSERLLAVASQPMVIRWVGAEPSEHTPDFFVRLQGGRGVLVDVRPAELIDDRARQQFDRTARFAGTHGWAYAVHQGFSRVRDANLRFLSRYRDPRWDFGEPPELPTGALGSLRDLAARLDDDGRGLARCYWLLWSQRVLFDQEMPLTPLTELYRGGI